VVPQETLKEVVQGLRAVIGESEQLHYYDKKRRLELNQATQSCPREGLKEKQQQTVVVVE
jgi:hypothetical protein